MNVRSAPTATRKLIKSIGYWRSELTRLSKSEEAGDTNAGRSREELIATITRHNTEAETAIVETERMADRFERSALICKTNSTDPHSKDPLAVLTAMACRLGVSGASLAPLLDHCATRARQAASDARDRLDDNHSDLLSLAHHCQYVGLLAKRGFKHFDPSVKRARSRAQSLRTKT